MEKVTNGCVTKGSRFGQTLRLPPISGKNGTKKNLVFKDNFLRSLPKLPRIKGNPLDAKVSPALQERDKNHKLSNPCPDRKDIGKLSGDSCRKPVANLEGADVAQRGRGHLNCTSQDIYSLKNDFTESTPIIQSLFQSPIHLLRRRIQPFETVYRHTIGQISHQEVLTFDQNIDQLSAFEEREGNMGLSDLNGTKFDANGSGNGDITPYKAEFGVKNKSRSVPERNSASKKNMPENKTPSKKERDSRVKDCFFEALDLHFYHYYRNTHPERRMAICEEIEQTICVDNTVLSSVRDYLRLQEILDGWML